MKRTPEPGLLDDVLAESAPAEFRDALLGETLRLARRRRVGRHARRGVVAAAIALAVGLLVWRSAPRAVTTSCEIVHTQPPPAGMIVSTRPFGAERIVASFASVSEVRTVRGAEMVHLVNDDELLALASPRPAALVRLGPGAQELVFVDVAERDDTR